MRAQKMPNIFWDINQFGIEFAWCSSWARFGLKSANWIRPIIPKPIMVGQTLFDTSSTPFFFFYYVYRHSPLSFCHCHSLKVFSRATCLVSFCLYCKSFLFASKSLPANLFPNQFTTCYHQPAYAILPHFQPQGSSWCSQISTPLCPLP